MTDRPTTRFHRLEGSMVLDGLTLRARLVGDQLTISLDDAAAAVNSLDLIDEQAGEKLLHRDDLAVRTRTRRTVKEMIVRLHGAGQTSALEVVARMHPEGNLDSFAMTALSQAAALAGRSDLWSWTLSAVRSSFGRLSPEEQDAIAPPFLAAAFVDLIGSHGFRLEHYETMTSSWRVTVGSLPHAGSEQYAAPPVSQAG